MVELSVSATPKWRKTAKKKVNGVKHKRKMPLRFTTPRAAAHCVDFTGETAGIHKSKVSQMEVYYGSKVFDGNGGTTAKVEAIYEHYDFVRGNLGQCSKYSILDKIMH